MPRQESAAPQVRLFASDVPTPTQFTALPQAALNIYQGDDKRWIFRLKKSNSSPFVLTGYTAAAQFRTAVADVDIDPPIVPSVVVTDAPNGEITMTLPSELSTALVQPQYVWDLEITETATSWTTTVAAGILVVTKEITRDTGLS